MLKVTLTIDGKQVQVEQSTTILEAAQRARVHIPTFCYLKEINAIGVCRICVVEVQGVGILQPACVTPVEDNMVVLTRSPLVRASRRTTLELILSNHPFVCPSCVRDQNCELQELAETLDISMYYSIYTNPSVPFKGAVCSHPIDDSSVSLVHDPAKCVLCRRCVAVCEKVQTIGAISSTNRGFDTVITTGETMRLADSNCVNCGQCITTCPTGALQERDHIEEVFAALADPGKHTVVQMAPSVRMAIAETYGAASPGVTAGQLAAALRQLGFDKVFEEDFAADLAIREEERELLDRMNRGDALPLITSYCPACVKFIEHFYPQLLPHLSTCKSPQQMFGALAKSYYAQEEGMDPKGIYAVSIVPCTAKKFEAQRPEMNSPGYRDVDAVLTTREVGRMLKKAEIDFRSILGETYDDPFGVSTGATAVSGAAGSAMKAALRAVYENVTQAIRPAGYREIRDLPGVKEAGVKVGGMKIRIAVAHSLGSVRKLLNAVVAGEAKYHVIVVMCCPGGCVSGGGQPITTDPDIRGQRIKGVHRVAPSRSRKSRKSEAARSFHPEAIDESLSPKFRKLLHTGYTPRRKYD